jgi:PPE-repeat protein
MGTSAQRKAPDPDVLATPAAAAASARESERARRRRRAAMPDHHRGYRYEFLDADSGTDAAPGADAHGGWAASDRGAGPLGFAGTAPTATAAAAGLATLDGDGFGGGPVVPMVPGAWESEGGES